MFHVIKQCLAFVHRRNSVIISIYWVLSVAPKITFFSFQTGPKCSFSLLVYFIPNSQNPLESDSFDPAETDELPVAKKRRVSVSNDSTSSSAPSIIE